MPIKLGDEYTVVASHHELAYLSDFGLGAFNGNWRSIYCEHNHSRYRIHTRKQGASYHASYYTSYHAGNHASYRSSWLTGYFSFQVKEEEEIHGRGAAICPRSKDYSISYSETGIQIISMASPICPSTPCGTTVLNRWIRS